MEKKISSAEEFLKQKPWIHGMSREDLSIAMIAFAKLHVEACKEEIYTKAEVYQHVKVDDYDYPTAEHFSITKNSVFNSYPLENIK